MNELSKGSRVDVPAGRYRVTITSPTTGLIDAAAVLLTDTGRVRTDDDFIFFNQPTGPGVAIADGAAVDVDLNLLPAEIDKVLITGSTEAQGVNFGAVQELSIRIAGASDHVFRPPALTTETVLQTIAFYRRGAGWRIDAIGQGYQDGLAAFATDHGITVDDPGVEDAGAVARPDVPAPQPVSTSIAPTPSAAPINMSKVRISMTKDSASKTAAIDLRKSQGDPDWVLTVGLEWDGRGAKYEPSGAVKSYGSGDLDVYFFVRNEVTDDYVVISGDRGHHGRLDTWPNVKHFGDSARAGSRRQARGRAGAGTAAGERADGGVGLPVGRQRTRCPQHVRKATGRGSLRQEGARRAARRGRRRDPRARRQQQECVLGDHRDDRRRQRDPHRRRSNPLQPNAFRGDAGDRREGEVGACPEGWATRAE